VAKPRRHQPKVEERSPGSLLGYSIGLVTITLAVYAGVWSFGFVQFDDPQYVSANPHIADGLTWRGITWAFTAFYALNWHPVTWLSHMIDVQLFGLAPGPPHAINLLLHLANVLLLFRFLVSATAPGTLAPSLRVGACAFVAALFAVHPLHVESVAWISERKDVLSTLFWLLTMHAYVRYVRGPDARRYALLLICFAIGLMAKPMLVTLPLVLLLIDWWPLARMGGAGPVNARTLWPLVREKLPLFALAAGASIATVVAQRLGYAVIRLEEIPLGLRVQNAIVSYAEYLHKMVWPTGLHMYYPYPASIPVWQVAAAAAALVAVTIVALVVAKKRPYVAVGWFWYVGTLVPVIGIVQVGRQALADRYTYVPLIGIFIIIAFGVAEFLSRRNAPKWLGVALALIVVVPNIVLARAQTQHWRNDQTLFAHAIEVAARLDARRATIATQMLLAEGSTGQLQTLIFSQTAGRDDFQALARQYLGNLFARHNLLDDAVAMLQDAIRINPSVSEFHGELGTVYVRQGKLDAGIAEFREAVRLAPNSATAHRNLAVALAQAGKTDEAIRELQEVLRLQPDAADVRQALADFLKKIGK